ncbi:MAG: hypothetical protein HC893_01890 [Chloroflexaceae bacterium]|nr:hypothetical protein [Chloroflexaceae bacterium]
MQNPSSEIPGMPTGEPIYPNAEYIVIIGGDEIIPFYRVPDLATVANELEYLPYLQQAIDPATGVIDRNSAIGGALAFGTYLTDDLYGDADSYELSYHPLFVPDLGVGRLVETPIEILAYFDQYLTGDALLTINAAETPDTRALATGYDFLQDQAFALQSAFESIGFQPNDRISLLATDDWNADDLTDVWFDGQFADLTTPFSYTVKSPFYLQSVNAHYDHWQAIPAVEEEGTVLADSILQATSASAADRYFTNRICYTVGCHGGLNIDATAIASGANPIYAADFPQAVLKQGGIWIGNTGYGYGDADLVGYGERMTIFFTEELGRDVRDPIYDTYIGQSVGTALHAPSSAISAMPPQWTYTISRP